MIRDLNTVLESQLKHDKWFKPATRRTTRSSLNMIGGLPGTRRTTSPSLNMISGLNLAVEGLLVLA